MVEPDIRVSGLGGVMTFPRMWECQGGGGGRGFPGSKRGGFFSEKRMGGWGDSWAGGG